MNLFLFFFYSADNSRPYLMTQVEKTTDYINAVFVNVSIEIQFQCDRSSPVFLKSYRQTSNYIATQYPLPHTLIDFWRLIFDHNISIIMLIESIPRDSVILHEYFCFYNKYVFRKIFPIGH
jgi:protein tyrosine phosphatase